MVDVHAALSSASLLPSSHPPSVQHACNDAFPSDRTGRGAARLVRNSVVTFSSFFGKKKETGDNREGGRDEVGTGSRAGENRALLAWDWEKLQ